MLQDVYVKSEDQHLNDPPQHNQQRPLPLDRVRYQDVRYELICFFMAYFKGTFDELQFDGYNLKSPIYYGYLG